MKNFALIGAAGFVARRHLKAIYETDNRLVVATDPNDTVGILDSYFPEAQFFTKFRVFERYLAKYQEDAHSLEDRVQYVSICSPNYLHYNHIRSTLKLGANAICEKPLTIDPKYIDRLLEVEKRSGYRVFNVLQLRLHPEIKGLKQSFDTIPNSEKAEVELTYITHRGQWYQESWKGSEDKSGGLLMNIGIHFFDMLLWVFGSVQNSILHLSSPQKMAGILDLERATVRWFLSIDHNDLPESYKRCNKRVLRSIIIDGRRLEFSSGFDNLHTEVYRNILSAHGVGIEDARQSLELVHLLRSTEPTWHKGDAHSLLLDNQFIF